MPIQATVILDSGCFLQMPPPEENIPKATEIGFFLSGKSVPDIKVRADGDDVDAPELADLGKKGSIEVRHVLANGKLKRDGVKGAKNFHKNLLHMRDLYGDPPPVINRKKFDCVIRFESGLFYGSLIKSRAFIEQKKQENGRYEYSPEDKSKVVKKPILHNVFIHFNLKKGEAIEITKDGKVIWSSKDSGAKGILEIEVVADNETTDKFYRMALKDKRESYWMPNWGDPPPVCSQPPCEP
jgi:hypothetical protein